MIDTGIVPLEDGSIAGIDEVKAKGKKSTNYSLVKSSMNDLQIESMRALTPKQYIKKFTGRGGKELSYIPAAIYIRKLNHTFGYGGWSFEQDKFDIMDGHAVVHGVLEIHSLQAKYAQFGGHPVAKDKNGNPIDIGDTLKAATSDALKKCCSMMGMFPDLYSPDDFVPLKENQKAKAVSVETKKEADAKTMQSISKLISKMDKKGLDEFMKKFESSDKYSKDQKAEIIMKLDERMKELKA